MIPIPVPNLAFLLTWVPPPLTSSTNKRFYHTDTWQKVGDLSAAWVERPDPVSGMRIRLPQNTKERSPPPRK
jgi:hypothetical protein